MSGRLSRRSDLHIATGILKDTVCGMAAFQLARYQQYLSGKPRPPLFMRTLAAFDPLEIEPGQFSRDCLVETVHLITRRDLLTLTNAKRLRGSDP